MEDPTRLGTSGNENKTEIKGNTTGGSLKGDFVAGTVLASRYRIIGLVGKGGMGEVYKAEDIKLSQTVALKFLPDHYQNDGEALERFHAEVRNARQVSHVNVCRVFDIGEIDGRHFLSMEFVDGDDLSELLTRVGRFTSERAIEISRQLCVGMEAIHKAGILHRDFKPANIIIDKKGIARITDFGIAGIESEIAKDGIRAGTPAYMAPEQITGKEVSTRSDIYALGLVIYEIFTGKQAFIADTIHELIKKHQTETPTNPSEIVKGIDPLVESVISQCLEKDPKDRPQSALHVAMALPGGNPMQIALDAGQTPSPEMIAATPVKGALRPLVALALLLAFIAAFSGAIYIRSIYATNAYAPIDKPPAVLAERSRTVIKNLGYTENPKDTDYKFDWDPEYYEDFVKKQDDPLAWTEKLRNGQPVIYYFRYRQSPDYLQTTDNSRITKDDPLMTVPGMVTVELDVTGRLTAFAAVPPADFSIGDRSAKTDWKKLFDEAGLEIASFRRVDTKWTPPVGFEETAAWEGMMAGTTDIPVRVEAAGFRARPVYFQVVPFWKESESSGQNPADGSASAGKVSFFLDVVVYAVMLIGPIFLVWYNVKRGRGDLNGAIKIGLLILTLYLMMAVLIVDSPLTFVALRGFLEQRLARGLFLGTQAGVIYLAIEPFVRRIWPETLISWSRLVIGNFRDPLIGRDILVGFLFGVVEYLSRFALAYIQSQFDPKAFSLLITNTETDHLMGAASALSDILDKLRSGLTASFGFLLIVLFMTFIFRKKFLGIAATFLILAAGVIADLANQMWSTSAGLIILAALWLFVLVRFGVLAFVSNAMLFLFLLDTAFTLDPSSFYFPSTVLMSATALALAGYAYYISLAGKKILGDGNFFGE